MLSTTWTVRGVGGTCSAKSVRIRMACTQSLYTDAHDSFETAPCRDRHSCFAVFADCFRPEAADVQSRSLVAAGDAEPLDHGRRHRRVRRCEATRLGDAPARDAHRRRALRRTVERGRPRSEQAEAGE